MCMCVYTGIKQQLLSIAEHSYCWGLTWSGAVGLEVRALCSCSDQCPVKLSALLEHRGVGYTSACPGLLSCRFVGKSGAWHRH